MSNRYYRNDRVAEGYYSGWKDSFGKKIPLTFHEIIDRRNGEIVAVFRNDGQLGGYGGISPRIAATMQLRYLNGHLSPAAAAEWEKVVENERAKP